MKNSTTPKLGLNGKITDLENKELENKERAKLGFKPLQQNGQAPMNPAPMAMNPTPTPITPAPTPITPAPTPITPAPAPITPAPVGMNPAPVAMNPAPAPITTPKRVDANTPKGEELGIDGDIADPLNKLRKEMGLPELTKNEMLDDPSDNQSGFNAAQQKLSAIGPDGSTPEMQIKNAGYPFENVAQLLAIGDDGAKVLDDWLKDPKSRDVLLDPSKTEFGIGDVLGEDGKLYWTINVGGPGPAPLKPAPVAMNPAPAPTNPAPMAMNPTPTPMNPAPTPITPAPAPITPAPAPITPAPVGMNPAPVAMNPAPAPITTPKRVDANTPEGEELGIDGDIADPLNKLRKEMGLPELTKNEMLDDPSDNQSAFNASQQKLSATGPDGSTLEMQVKNAGFPSTNVAQVLAIGDDGAKVLADALKDPVQSAKLLNPTFNEFGIGDVVGGDRKLYWTINLGGPDKPTPTPITPAPTPMNPAPTPMNPAPTPMNPAPAPMNPAPTPMNPAPAPVDPMGKPVDPMGDPVDKPKKGRNEILGGDGNDTLNGGNGRDILKGVAGNDILKGGDSNDILVGGTGNDILTGGAGNDKFSFSGGKLPTGQSVTAFLGTDTITDFTAGDKIFLSKEMFSALGNDKGKLNNANFAQVASDGLVDTNSAKIVYSKGSGSLSYNANGNAAGLGDGGGIFATLTGKPDLTADIFKVVG